MLKLFMLNVHPIPAFTDNYIWAIVYGNSCIVVDPGDSSPVFDFLKSNNLDLESILITHHHFDHTGGMLALAKKYNCPVYGPAGDHIEGLTNKGLKMTRKDIDQVNKLQTKFEEIKELIPSVNNRQASQYPYIPFYKKEQWGALGLKYAIRKAAKEDLDYVTINPYEIVHHREGARLGNLEFYGNKRGGGDILERVKGTLTERQVAFIDKLAEKRGFQPGSAGYIKLLQEAAGRDPVARKALAKELNVSGVDGLRNDGKKKATAEGATLPNFLKKFAEDYGTEVESIRVAKSDPSKTVKFVDEIEIIDPDTGKPGKFEQHIAAFTEEEYEALLQSNQRPLTHIGYKVVKRKPDDLE